MSLDDSFTLNSGHSCRGLRGLALDHISPHQLRNGVQIAALIPGLVRREELCAHAANQRPRPANELFDRLTTDSSLTSVCPAFSVHSDTSALSIFSGRPLHFFSMRAPDAEKCFWVFSEIKAQRWHLKTEETGDTAEGHQILSQSWADLAQMEIWAEFMDPSHLSEIKRETKWRLCGGWGFCFQVNTPHASSLS